MDSFVIKKRKRPHVAAGGTSFAQQDGAEDSTDFKLAVLASLNPDVDDGVLLEALLASEGSVDDASNLLQSQTSRFGSTGAKKIRSSALGQQASLAEFNVTSSGKPLSKSVPITKKGKTLHLYAPADIEEHTPCSIIHNFLPSAEADALLRELLAEAPTFGRQKFKLFDRVVESPHTSCFYVESYDAALAQQTEYIYNGAKLNDVRPSLPEMLKVAAKVRTAVNQEIQRRTKERYPGGKKLPYQSPDEWVPNCSFVNCYDGAKESVGYHSDQLTYLGPRAIIGSLSLGVAREFRVRRVVARDEEEEEPEYGNDSTSMKPHPERQDLEGQIAIHLPHNSLLVMHAEMQEEWKHSISPAQTINPHPVAGNKRINITYRCYKDHLHPKYTPRCKCGIPCVLRCVQKKKGNRGRYMWQCHSHYSPEKDGCQYFQWAEFDNDGYPPWALKPAVSSGSPKAENSDGRPTGNASTNADQSYDDKNG